jgi:hypothetical protein
VQPGKPGHHKPPQLIKKIAFPLQLHPSANAGQMRCSRPVLALNRGRL